MGGCSFGNVLPINVPKKFRGKIHLFDIKSLNSSENYYLEPGLYHSITNIVEAMKTLIQHGRNHTVQVSGRRHKIQIQLANEGSVLAFSVLTWVFFGSNVRKDFECF